jgi:lipopolysaccharide/colanic/teichoic acid biosynthesis glycosyltransferase
MIARPVGRVLAFLGLVASSPILAAAAGAIKASSPGPVLFRAARAGQGDRPFTMYKLRTMHHGTVESGTRITANHDPRIFAVGRWLRRLKLDELPQLVNVVRGQMALVGPRPEDLSIVADHYTPLMRETLDVLPGITSPGSLAYFADEQSLPQSPQDAERLYLTEILPRKIALDLVYVRNSSWRYDAELVVRTVASIVGAHNLFRRHREWEQAEAATLMSADARHLSLGDEATR